VFSSSKKKKKEPLNYAVRKILPLTSKDGCEEKSNLFCVECTENFCDDCFEFNHRKGTKKNHNKAPLRKKKSHFCEKHKEKIQSFCLTCKEFSCFYCCATNGEHFGHDSKLLKDAVKFIQEHNDELKKQFPNIEKSISMLKEEKKFFTTKVKGYLDSCDEKILFLQESFSNSEDLQNDPNVDTVELCLGLKMICSISNSLNGTRLKEIQDKFKELDEIMFPRKGNSNSMLYQFKFDYTQRVVVQNENQYQNAGDTNQVSSNVMSTKPIPPNSICYFEVDLQNISTCSFFGVIPEGYAGIHNNWLCSCGSKNKGYGIQGNGNSLLNGTNSENLFSNSSSMNIGVLVDTRNYTISLTNNHKFLKTYSLEKYVKYYPAMMVYSTIATATLKFPSPLEVKKIFENTSIIIVQ
jgi:hypothetical protein